MSAVLDVHWCIGHQKLGGGYFRDLQARDERIHLKTIGKLTISPGTTPDDMMDTVDAVWVLGRIDAPEEVRELFRERRRWKPSSTARRNRTCRIVHHMSTVGTRMSDQGVGFVWFDRYELEKRLALGVKTDLTVTGVLSFASDVTATLVGDAFGSIRIRGAVFADATVRRAVKALPSRP